MPGNEVRDRVHNFFAQEDLSSGHHHSQAVDGSLQALGNNLWAGGQRHIGLPSSNSQVYNLQQSDFERGQNGYSFQVVDRMNYAQPSQVPEVAKSSSQGQLFNSNGYMDGRQFFQTRRNEANFLGVNTEPDRYAMTSGGLSVYESQGANGLENNISSRSEPSESRVSFDFLGAQPLMSRQQMGMLPSLPQQLSGFNEVQLLQQQGMLRKMVELQRQQLETRQQNSVNQNLSVITRTPISPITEASNDTWATEPMAGNKSWLHCATQAVRGPSNEYRFPSEQGQALSLMGLVPQQVDQSLYGVPVSGTRGTSSQCSHVSLNKHLMLQLATHVNGSPVDKYTGFTDQVNVQDGSLSSRQGFQEEIFFCQQSGQGLTRELYSGNPQLGDSLHRDASRQLDDPSEAVQGKVALPFSSSQNAVALDPTEEKILFGDGNIWDSSRNSGNMGAETSLWNSTGLLNGLPSLQSGSWSALMQSAVGETSVTDQGFHEEWSDPSIQNAEVAVGPLSDNVNINKSYQGILGFQQAGLKFPCGHDDKLQMDSIRRSLQQSSGEGSKWLSHGPLRKPLAEGTQIYQNAAQSSVSEINAKSTPGRPAPQQNVLFHYSGQPYCSPNGCDAVEAPASSVKELSRFYEDKNKFKELSRFYEDKNKLQCSSIDDQKRMMHGEMSQGGNVWKAASGPKPNVGLEQVKSGVGSPHVNRDELTLNNLSGKPNSSTSEGKGPNTHHLNFRDYTESPKLSKGNEHHLLKGPLDFQSSMNSSGPVKMHEIESNERKENSGDSHRSNLSQQAIASGSNDKILLDGSDARNSLRGKRMVPGQSGQKAPGPRKFQYHPMGNLDEDVESSYGRKYFTDDQSQGYLGQFNSFNQFLKTSSEMEKGHLPSVEQNKKQADDLPSRGCLAGFAPDNPASFDGGFGTYALNKVAQSSQNKLRFLHNVDQSKQISNSGGAAGSLEQSQSSPSHGFGLQLGFSSQLLPTQNCAFSSHSSAKLASSLSSAHAVPEIKGMDNAQLASAAQVQSFPPFHETSERKYKRNDVTGQSSNEASQYGMLGNLTLSNSGFPFSRSQIQHHEMISAVDGHDNLSSHTRINQKDSFVSSGDTNQQSNANSSHERITSQEISMKRASNAWTKVPSQQNIFGGQPHTNLPPSLRHPCQSNDTTVLVSSSEQVDVCGKGQAQKGSLYQLASSADLAPSVSQGKESFLKNQTDASPSTSASTERDFEAFGRSLKPNNISHQNYSLLNQIRAMKSTEIDSSSRGLKRFKGAEGSVGYQMGQSSEQNVMVGDPNAGSSHHVNVLPQDLLAPSRRDSENHICSSTSSFIGVEHPQISPQMAPSWFSQYGTFRNGQMLSVHDPSKHEFSKTIDPQFALEKSFDTMHASNSMGQGNAAADSHQAGNIWQTSTSTPVVIENFSSTNLHTSNVIDQGLVVAREKKRKSVATLPPWHKGVTHSSQSFLSTSKAEVEWANAANRLIDKVEDDAEMVEDGPPSQKPKRRLVLTAQLMQQLFRPPVFAILFADANVNYGSVTCMVARGALGDACSLIPCSESDCCEPLDNSNLLPEKHKASEGISGQHLSEVTEHFTDRARKLETDFMRLDKRASVVDLRVESQDLEKVSVINRFARYHGRGQADAAPPFPQRYVNALPLPRNLPESVHCLSL